MAAQIKDPTTASRRSGPALEAMDGKIVACGYPFGEYDMLIVFEVPDDTTAASIAQRPGLTQ